MLCLRIVVSTVSDAKDTKGQQCGAQGSFSLETQDLTAAMFRCLVAVPGLFFAAACIDSEIFVVKQPPFIGWSDVFRVAGLCSQMTCIELFILHSRPSQMRVDSIRAKPIKVFAQALVTAANP